MSSISCQDNRTVNVSLTLDMEKRSLNISLNYSDNYGNVYYGNDYYGNDYNGNDYNTHRNQSSTNNYNITGKQVSPYFSISSSCITLSIVE